MQQKQIQKANETWTEQQQAAAEEMKLQRRHELAKDTFEEEKMEQANTSKRLEKKLTRREKQLILPLSV